MKQIPYFYAFLGELPPDLQRFSKQDRLFWHIFAGATIGFGIWYLHWRWTVSLNPEALIFSILVAMCETAAFVGTILFYFDIWDEDDTPRWPPPNNRTAAGLEGDGDILVDIFITTFDEDVSIVSLSLDAALCVDVGTGVSRNVYVLDDGARPEMRKLARQKGARYFSRSGNRGFKAGNLANALFQTKGDFIVICDADTQLFSTFIAHTLGYFRDPKVSWVQTPHWFYDLPKGRSWSHILSGAFGQWSVIFAPVLQKVTGKKRDGDDLFLSNPELFFDVIQRRRNRNGASFCCGAGSIHRREAIFENALYEQGSQLSRVSHSQGSAKSLLPRLDLQPFRYHVSEDIFTSIQHHKKGWKSVYHPQVEARMLSPWSVSAWAIQKLKYAGGTFDIMVNANPLFQRGMPWRTKLHYLSTFASYLAVLWLPILVLAPAASLVTGVAPMASYSVDFFIHILPVLVANELAMNAACKGKSMAAGRILSIGTLYIQWRALLQVLSGQKPHFLPTPKTPVLSASLRHAMPNLALSALLLGALLCGAFRYVSPDGSYSTAFFVVNAFWIVWAVLALGRVAKCALITPQLPEAPVTTPQ